MGSASFGDARGRRRSNSHRRSGAQLGPAGGERQRGRAGARLGRARRTTATCRAAATAAATPGDGSQPRSTCADLGRAFNSARAVSTHRRGGSDLGGCSPGTTTAAGARAILGRAGSRRTGRAAGPHLGLARTRAFAVGAASAAFMGCPQTRSPTPARGAVVGQ